MRDIISVRDNERGGGFRRHCNPHIHECKALPYPSPWPWLGNLFSVQIGSPPTPGATGEPLATRLALIGYLWRHCGQPCTSQLVFWGVFERPRLDFEGSEFFDLKLTFAMAYLRICAKSPNLKNIEKIQISHRFVQVFMDRPYQKILKISKQLREIDYKPRHHEYNPPSIAENLQILALGTGGTQVGVTPAPRALHPRQWPLLGGGGGGG